MILTYNSIPIATEFADGGTDSVQGFDPEAKSNVQTARPLRSAYVTLFARGNREVTLTGTIIPATGMSLEDALLKAEAFYASLPDQGDLVKTVNGSSVTYFGAVLESCKVVKRLGVSYGFQLTFRASKSSTFAAATDAPITEPGGAPLTDPSGVPITDPS